MGNVSRGRNRLRSRTQPPRTFARNTNKKGVAFTAQLMKKFEALLEKYLNPIAGWVSNNKVLSAISAGMVSIMPFTLIAAVFSIVESLPDYLPFLPDFSEEASAALLVPYNFLFGILALLVVFMVAYHYAKHYKLHQINCGLVALVTFCIIASSYESEFLGPVNIDGTYFGYGGIFTAILVAIFSVQLYRVILQVGLKIRMPETVPPLVRDSFEAIIPFALVISAFYVVSLVFESVTGMIIPAFIQNLITPVINASDGLGYIWLTGVLSQFFWWLGMHGWTLVSAPLMSVTNAKLAEQAAAYAAGQELPYIVVGGWSFSPYAYLLPVLLLVLCKAKRNRSVGKMSLVPALFCITEPYVFGLPIVMNPLLLIPWVTAGCVTNTVAYVAIRLGLMNRSFTAELSTIPTPINTFLTNGDWRTFIWFIVATVITAAVWYPFLKVWDKKCLEEEKGMEKLERK